MKKLNVTFCSFPDYSSNAKPLYDYMKKRYNNQMNFVWIVRTNESYQNFKKQKIDAYIINTEEYFDYIKKADVIFSTHADLIQNKPENCLYIELWHGIGCKKSGYILNIINDLEQKWCKLLSQKVDYMIVPTDFWATLFAAIFKVDKNRILSLGYPKFDDMLKTNADKNLSKVLNLDIKEYEKILFYTPTFSSGVGRNDKIKKSHFIDLDDFNERELLEYLEKKNYLLCIKRHPSEEGKFGNLNTKYIKNITDSDLAKFDYTINDVLNASDLLISDYSSLIVEYTFLNKPVICLNASLKRYSQSRGIVFENYDFWTTGLVARTLNDFLECIEVAFTMDIKENRYYQDKRNLWIGNMKNGGCKKICDYIFEDNQISSNVKIHKDLEEELKNKISSLTNEITTLKECVNEQKTTILKQNDVMFKQEQTINNMVNSRGWKLLEKIRKIKNR